MASVKRLGTLATCAVAGWLATGCGEGAKPVQQWVYFGTGADHIYVSSFDASTGTLGVPREAAPIGRPGFLALHPRGDILYAVGREREDGSQFEGEAVALAIDLETGGLSELNRASTSGRGASHVAVNTAATVLAAVNYGDGNTVTVSLEPDGRLGEPMADMPHSGSSIHPTRQGEPHPHSANFTPDGLFLVVPDLGTDELVKYAVNSQTAQLERTPDPQARMEPGAGPRHMTFHSNGRWAYVINELASTLTAMHYEAETGLLEHVQTISTLPDGYEGPANTTAEVLVHPNGRFLYGSNRGSNTIAVFAIHPGDGQLELVERVPTGGDWPRNFRLSPDGRFLLAANQRSDSVNVFSVDVGTGRLRPTGASVAVPNPMCIRFVPAI